MEGGTKLSRTEKSQGRRQEGRGKQSRQQGRTERRKENRGKVKVRRCREK